MAINLNSINVISQGGMVTSTLSSAASGSSISNFIGSSLKNQGTLDIFGFLTNKKAVALFDENDQEVLTDCVIHTVDITDEARLAEQPLEDGTNISDHKVFLQKEATLVIYLPEDGYSSSVSELYDLYTENKFLKLQAKSQMFSNLQIIGLPHREDNASVYRMVYKIQLKEAITVAYSIRGYSAKGAGNAKSRFSNAQMDPGRTFQSKVLRGIENVGNKILQKDNGANPKAESELFKYMENQDAAGGK